MSSLNPEVPMRGRALATPLSLLLPAAAVAPLAACASRPAHVTPASPEARAILEAFAAQGLPLSPAEAAGLRADVDRALAEVRAHGVRHSRVGFAAVQIALDLGRGTDGAQVARIQGALAALAGQAYPPPTSAWRPATPPPPPPPQPRWNRMYDETLALGQDAGFLSLLAGRGFHPVKISWEDIGRTEGSCWGDRISDVGIWVRRREGDPGSARLALSVRRDGNFRDKVLLVPAERIKVHRAPAGGLVERTLPERLRELGLACPERDRQVIVSQQFAILPVPPRGAGAARSAFTFSIFPYGSTNLVITDVLEGSHEAVVGPGGHQLLFADVHGAKAPFTASRAAERPDLLALEATLRARGMDVDVQRYYLIQVPLRRDAWGIRLSAMGAPPQAWQEAWAGSPLPQPGDLPMAVPSLATPSAAAGAPAPPPVFQKAQETGPPMARQEKRCEDPSGRTRRESEGLVKVAIGHGEAEGAYHRGSWGPGARAPEPIRVTVVTLVTPVGRVTRRDMDAFARTFSAWDREALWGGSFVLPGTLP